MEERIILRWNKGSIHESLHVCSLFSASSFLNEFQLKHFAKNDISSGVYNVALEQAPGVCVYAGSACKWISPRSPHLSYQSVNVSPRWWTLSIQKIKFLLYSHFYCSAAAEVKKQQPMTCSTSLALAGCTFFKLASARLLEVTTMEDINIQKAHVVFPVCSFC